MDFISEDPYNDSDDNSEVSEVNAVDRALVVDEEVREAALQREFVKKMELFQTMKMAMAQNSLRYFGTLLQALEHRKVNQSVVGQLSVFAIPKPKKARGRVTYTKLYVTGSARSFFRYCHTIPGIPSVPLDEVVPVDTPCRLHFDVEIKLGDDIRDWKDVLRLHLTTAPTLDWDDALLSRLSSKYNQITTQPWTEDVCRAGLRVICVHIIQTLKNTLPADTTPDAFAMHVVSGCRSDKFSLHIVLENIFCDGQALSMPVLVFEIARWFSKRLITWVIRNEELWDTPEGHFRIRALMLDCLLTDYTYEPPYYFKGYDDTPFDEAIYAPNHMLRAPGGCKMESTSGALAPIDIAISHHNGKAIVEARTPVMAHERHFHKIFPFSTEGFEKWEAHTVCARGPSSRLSRPYLLTGWKPSGAYPSPRRWYSNFHKHGASTADMAGVFEVVDTCELERYTEPRPTKPRRVLSLVEQNAAYQDMPADVDPMKGREVVELDEKFRSESGEIKPFRRFAPGEFLHHVHGGREERTPSGKVFVGGFTCFGCNNVYSIPRTSPKEPPFPFADEEIFTSEDPAAYIATACGGPIDWAERTRKKFCVINAPMGSGKTHELKGLVDNVTASRHKSICVVSFRRILALQQAQRLVMKCYLDEAATSLSDHRFLVICVNSLFKLGPRDYTHVVLDECGLIRRHFLSAVTAQVLGKVYDRFTRLIRNAKFVVMLQDGISLDDVQFYTDIDNTNADDRTKVSALSLVKPIVVHPLRWTTKIHVAMDVLKRKYITSLDAGACMNPFLVFCSSCRFAEFIVSELCTAAAHEGSDPNRIKGMWGAIRSTDKFCVDFARDPNATANEADVVVCTSVVGAGFSITRRFQSFHAFLFTNILDHNEEKQFVRRLRFVMEDLPSDAIRDSYMFIEKGHGKGSEFTQVLSTFKAIRKMMLESGDDRVGTESVSGLARTLARVKTEKDDTREKHVELWINWGKSINSTFESMDDDEADDKEAEKAFRASIKAFSRTREREITGMILGVDDGNDLDLTQLLNQWETDASLPMYRAAAAQENQEKLSDGYVNVQLATALISASLPKEADRNKFFGNKSKIRAQIKGSQRLVTWLCYVYRNLDREHTDMIWEHMRKKPFNAGHLRTTCNLKLAHFLLPKILSPLPGKRRLRYLVSAGCTPFFNGAEVAGWPGKVRSKMAANWVRASVSGWPSGAKGVAGCGCCRAWISSRAARRVASAEDRRGMVTWWGWKLTVSATL